MAEEFKTIETQEQLDSILKGRLERQKETLTKEHSEATAELQRKLRELELEKSSLSKKVEEYDTKYAGIDDRIKDYESKIKKYETDSVKTRIARSVGLPDGIIDRLRGETEKEIQADAEALAKFMPKPEPPMKSTEQIPGKNQTQADLNNWLKTMKQE